MATPVPPVPLAVDVSRLVADAVTVDALARLALVARRSGCELRIDGATPHLRELVGFMGLASVLATA